MVIEQYNKEYDVVDDHVVDEDDDDDDHDDDDVDDDGDDCINGDGQSSVSKDDVISKEQVADILWTMANSGK